MFLSLVIVTMLRKKKYRRCSNMDWVLILSLIIAAAINTFVGIRNIKKEYIEKVEANY
jgi:ABC-type nitrate/sulfonate/bicarbonate transport system permease component